VNGKLTGLVDPSSLAGSVLAVQSALETMAEPGAAVDAWTPTSDDKSYAAVPTTASAFIRMNFSLPTISPVDFPRGY
jgi:hypothetical protein